MNMQGRQTEEGKFMHNPREQALTAPTGTDAAVEPRVLDHDLPMVSPLPLMQLSIGFWSFKALATRTSWTSSPVFPTPTATPSMNSPRC